MGSEVLDQLDLLVGERTDFLPVDCDRANQRIVFEHWHRNDRSRPTECCRSAAGFIGRVAHLLCSYNAIDQAAWNWLISASSGLQKLGKGRWYVVHGTHAQGPILMQVQYAEFGLAEPHCIRQHGFEHRRKLARRAGDHLQHLGGRRLLFQRLGQIGRALAQLVEQARVLYGDHCLGGEVFGPVRSACR